MLKAIGFLIKLVVFSVVILMIGNYFTWEGKTISDQIRTQMSQAEHSELAANVRNWSGGLLKDMKKGANRVQQSAPNREDSSNSSEKIDSSERQKLRALIRELNGSRSRE